MNDEIIRTENLSFAYPTDNEKNKIYALKNINLTVRKGEFVAILGRNGSGKSTLAKLLNLILIPNEGKIYIGDTPLNEDMSEEEIISLRRRIGMVFQNPDNQLVATVVEEDIAFGPENLGIAPKEIRKRVDDALKTVGMSKFAKHSPHQLSGGQKQRVAIAGILAMMPECIIFDESTAMLDPKGRHDVMETVEKLNRENGLTVITITHNMEEAVRADRIIVIDQGEIVKEGTPKEVFSDVPKMHSIGLTVPQPAYLCYCLKSKGIDMPNGILTEEECADVICNLMKANQGKYDGNIHSTK